MLHDDELPIDAALVRTLIAEQLPQHADQPVTRWLDGATPVVGRSSAPTLAAELGAVVRALGELEVPAAAEALATGGLALGDPTVDLGHDARPVRRSSGHGTAGAGRRRTVSSRQSSFVRASRTAPVKVGYG